MFFFLDRKDADEWSWPSQCAFLRYIMFEEYQKQKSL
jgi:hypothetical protein